MSQYLIPDILPASHTGNDLATFINQWKVSVLSSNSGASRPTYAIRGTIWVKTTSTQDSIYYYTGTYDVLLFTIDNASGTIVSGGGGSGNNAINFKGAIDPTATAPTATNGDYYISNTAGIIHSSFTGIAGEVGSATDVLIYDGAFWSRIANTVDLTGYLPLGGGTMTGPLILSRDPVDPMEAATRQFVIAQAGVASLPLTGGTLTGPLVLPGDPTNPLEAAPKQYVDAQDALLLPLAGGTMTGPLVLSGAPTGANYAATKNYVDNYHDPSKLDVAGGTLTGPVYLAGNAVSGMEPVTYTQFLTGTESVQVSTGSPSANKLVRTNAIGKIDNSLLSISTGFTYGGQLDPTDPAPANINGNYYILNADGTFDASYGSPLAGTTGNTGDVIISNGSTWELSPVSGAGGAYLDRDSLNLVGTNFEILANYSVPSTMISGGDPDLAFLANLGIPGGIFGMPNNKVGLIYSDSSGGVPSVSDLSTSCLGFNRADLKLYGLDSADNVESLIAIPTFTATGMYGQNDLVMHNDRFLQARAAISAGAMNAAQWHDITPGISEYSATAVYMQDELVSYAGGLYKCLADNTGPETFTPANWEAIDSSGFSANKIENGNSKVEIASANGSVDIYSNNKLVGQFTGSQFITNLDAGIATTTDYSADFTKSCTLTAHPFTGIAPATIFYRSSNGATVGGFDEEAFASGSEPAFAKTGYTQAPSTTGASGVFTFAAYKSNGTTGAIALDDTEDAFTFLNGATPILNLKGNGDAYVENELFVGGTSLTDLIAGGSGGIPTKIENGTSKVECATTNSTIVVTVGGNANAYFQPGYNQLNYYLNLSTPSGNGIDIQKARTGIAQPFTGHTSTGTIYNRQYPYSSTLGGVLQQSFAGGSICAFAWNGYLETPSSNGVQGVFRFSGYKSNGSTGSADLLDTDDLFVIANGATAKIIAKGNGSLTTHGNLQVIGTSQLAKTVGVNYTPNAAHMLTIGRTITDTQTNSILCYNYGTGAHVSNSNSLRSIYETGISNITSVNHLKCTTAGADVFTVRGDGLTTINNTLILGQSALNNLQLDFYSAYATAHPFTTVAGSGTLFAWSYVQDTGYLVERNCSASIIGRHWAIYSNGAPTAETSAVIDFRASNTDGAGGSTDHAATATIFAVKNHFTPAFSIKGNGDGKFAGQVTDYTAINAQTGTTYTTVLTDASKMITMTNAAANTVTIPANASVAYPVGTKLHFMQGGAGQTTIAITTDTLNKNSNFTLKLNGQYAVATAFKQTSTTWVLYGNLEPV